MHAIRTDGTGQQWCNVTATAQTSWITVMSLTGNNTRCLLQWQRWSVHWPSYHKHHVIATVSVKFTSTPIAHVVLKLPTNFNNFYDYSFTIMHRTGQTDHVTLWPWPLRSRRCLVRRGFVLHLCTKFEFRRPYHLEHIRHFVWELLRLSASSLTFWPWNWCAILRLSWGTFLPILVFPWLSVLHLWTDMCHTGHVTL